MQLKHIFWFWTKNQEDRGLKWEVYGLKRITSKESALSLGERIKIRKATSSLFFLLCIKEWD